MNEEWSKIFEIVDIIDNKMNIYQRIRFDGPLVLKLKKDLDMGPKDLNDTNYLIAQRYLTIKDDIVYLKEGSIVKASIASNDWVKIVFENGDAVDVAFDSYDGYDKYFEVIRKGE